MGSSLLYVILFCDICISFSFLRLFSVFSDAILVFLKLNILFTTTGLLLGMRVYKLCISSVALFLEKIESTFVFTFT